MKKTKIPAHRKVAPDPVSCKRAAPAEGVAAKAESTPAPESETPAARKRAPAKS